MNGLTVTFDSPATAATATGALSNLERARRWALPAGRLPRSCCWRASCDAHALHIRPASPLDVALAETKASQLVAI